VRLAVKASLTEGLFEKQGARCLLLRCPVCQTLRNDHAALWWHSDSACQLYVEHISKKRLAGFTACALAMEH
jgi:hypothetical protein